MKRRSLLFSIFFLIFVLQNNTGIAQCEAFVKKNCMRKISPFTHNGQMHAVKVIAGQTTELNMNFSAGQIYRILVCSEAVLEEVSFRVLDKSRKVIFDSQQHNNPDFWDFKVKNAQQFIVQVLCPPSSSTSSTPPSGCVSILVGFKTK